MFTAQQIKPNMKVIDTEGKHIGIVDHVEDDVVGLTREGFADDLHHFVTLAAVMKIDDDTLVVEPGQATTVEAVVNAIRYARRRAPAALSGDPIFGTMGGVPVFGTTGRGTGDGG